MFAQQDLANPSTILDSIISLSNPEVTEVRLAVAYVTVSGCMLLLPELEKSIGGKQWSRIKKTIITCFDFGHTEPAAIELMQKAGAWEVRVSRSAGLAGPTGTASHFSFHPKIYMFCKSGRRHMFVGSANLSRRALTINTEAGSSLLTPSPLGLLSFASDMGPVRRWFCQWHGTTLVASYGTT